MASAAVPRLSLRIAVVQLNPKPLKIGQVQANLARARELCDKLQTQTLDLLCFPEMAFTGYVFNNAASISPYLELPRTGPTSQFCSEIAKKLQCYVLAGYPEKLASEELETHTPTEEDATTSIVGANSAAMYGPDGDWIGGYRKTNLFETDRTWAKAGNGFATFHLPPPLRSTSLGICMDLNPQPPTPWVLETGPYELADYCVEKKTNVLVLLNAFLAHEAESGEADEDHDWHTLKYWAARLRPLWVGKEGDLPDADAEESEDTSAEPSSLGSETVVVVCNRCGEENGKTFAGTSAIFSMTKGSGRPKLLDMMKRKEEGVRVWNISV